jgi:hypothetical protein
MSDRLKTFKSKIESAKARRRELVAEWQENRERLTAPAGRVVAEPQKRRAMTTDATLVKKKASFLYSQVPEVRLTAKQKQYEPAVPVFAKSLNDTLKESGVGAAMYEGVRDGRVAGIAAAIVTYTATAETVQVPAQDPLMWAMTRPGEPVPMVPVERVADKKFTTKRISPADLIVDVSFRGSDFDSCPLLGHTGKLTWAEAKRTFGLKDADRTKVCGTTDSDSLDRLNPDDVANRFDEDAAMVEFDEIFVKSYLFDAGQVRFDAIHHLVFVKGLDQPVVDEPWKGQRFDEKSRRYVGACRYPIRVLTTDYQSDSAYPAAEVSMTRGQVDSLARSRSNMMEHKEHNRPIRTFNPSMVDKSVKDALMRGDWQGLLPVLNVDRAFGAVPQVNYPRDDHEFDEIYRRELAEYWSLGENQGGSFAPTGRSASEATIVQANFQSLIGQERGRVADWFVGIAEVMAGLLALFGDFEIPELSPEDQKRLGTWDRATISQHVVFTVRADSTVAVEAQSRIQQLMSILNITAKAPYVNSAPIVREIVSLAGFDPEDLMQEPPQAAPEPVNFSLRISGEDLTNPMVVGAMAKRGLLPTGQEMEDAKLAIADAKTPSRTPIDQLQQQPQPGPAPGAVDEQFPDWNTAARIDRRNSGSEG